MCSCVFHMQTHTGKLSSKDKNLRVAKGVHWWSSRERRSPDSRLLCIVFFGHSTFPEAARLLFWTLLPPAGRGVREAHGAKSGRSGVQLCLGNCPVGP